MDLRQLRLALRRYWPLALVVFLLTVVVGFVTGSSQSTTASSTAVVAASPNAANGGGVEDVVFEIPRIIETATSIDFISRALADESQATRDADVTVEGTNDDGTGIIRIEAQGADPAVAAAWANAVGDALAAQYAGTPVVTTTDPAAVPPTTPEEPIAIGPEDLIAISVIDPAVEGTTADRDALPIVLASGVLGVILGVIAAALAYQASNAVGGTADLETEIGVPVLGSLPSVRELRKSGSSVKEGLALAPPVLVDSLQTLRANVESRLGDDRVLAVTSWQGGEGKSVVTAGLALTLASVGHPVIGVDADIREPDLHLELGEATGPGLAALSSGSDDMWRAARMREPEDVIQPTHLPTLKLVPAGQATKHPAQVVSAAIPLLLDSIASHHADAYVLVDCPSLGPTHGGGAGGYRAVAETFTVLRQIRRVLLVVDASTTRAVELSSAVRSMRDEGIDVIGTFVNRRSRIADVRPFRGAS